MAEVTYKIKDFEGPLDLLLHLVSVHKMQLFDFNIYELIDQYLDFMGNIGPDELEPTSEFIEMAARLVYMKSVALLPRTEETEQMERELTGKLIEYSLCKLAASKLRDRSEGVNYFVRGALDIRLPNDYDHRHEARELRDAFLLMQGRQKKMQDVSKFEPLLTAPVVSVESRVVHIMSRLSFQASCPLGDFFRDPKSRSETVATFLGVLELIRSGDIRVDGEGVVSAVKKREGETE